MAVTIDERTHRRLRRKLKRTDFARLERHLRALAARLENDPQRGDHVARSRIPKRFQGLPSLWTCELPGSWRVLYTIAGFPGRGVEVRIVWVSNHRDHDRLFGYGSRGVDEAT